MPGSLQRIVAGVILRPAELSRLAQALVIVLGDLDCLHLAIRTEHEKTTAMANDIYANNVSDYVCAKQATAEKEQFFRKRPINIGLSCLVPKPGDIMTHDLTGIPILLVRRQDGSLGAFLNVCRHRGARVAEGCGNAKLFTFPFHAWTYDAGGKLRGRPDEHSFAGLEKVKVGLRPLPIAEKYGMIWVSPTPGPTFEIAPLLGGLERDLAAYKLEGYHHYETGILRRQMNWKMVIDTFLETYYLQFLHPKTICPILHSNLATFDAFGRNLRMIAARRTIEQLRATPQDQWNIIPLTAVICVLFSNTRPSLRIRKKRENTGTRISILLMATVEDEDFPMAEGIQRGFHSPAQEAIHFGRNEPALQHFHKSVKMALGMS